MENGKKIEFDTGRFYHPTIPQILVCTYIREDRLINFIHVVDEVRGMQFKLYGCPLERAEILRRYDRGEYELA